MNLDAELRDFLLSPPREPTSFNLDGSPRKPTERDPDLVARNSALVLDLYGFGAMDWPTLEELLPVHDFGTKQAASLAKKNYYLRYLESGPLSGVRRVAEILVSRPIWLETEFLAELSVHGISGLPRCIGALLEYLQSQSLVEDYIWMGHDLSLMGRRTFQDAKARFIVQSMALPSLQRDMEFARKVAGNAGIGELASVREARPEADLAVLRAIIPHDLSAWTTERDGEFWFTFNERRNRLVNAVAKTFAAVETCDPGLLTNVLYSALHDPTLRYRAPDEEIIRRWIHGGPNFRQEGSGVAYLGEADPLTREEQALRDIMKGQVDLSGPWLTAELMKRTGLKVAAVGRHFYHSPLVVIDRTRGSKRATYTFITDYQTLKAPPVETPAPSPAEMRRQELTAALAAVGETDGTTSARYRREQTILARLLFEDEVHSCCAICGREFGTSSLVAAHKKRRADCSEDERKDPDIVFPLCVFGCDYLYEARQILIQDGVVVAGRSPTGATEALMVSQLVGRRLDAKWLQGPQSYFAALREAVPEPA